MAAEPHNNLQSGPQWADFQIVTTLIDTAFTILTLDNSVYQITPNCIDLREHPILLTVTKQNLFTLPLTGSIHFCSFNGFHLRDNIQKFLLTLIFNPPRHPTILDTVYG